MSVNKLSLRTRIFIAMILLVVLASVLIAAVTIYQYNEQAEDYHQLRLERKEEAVKTAITYELGRDSIESFETLKLPDVLDRKLNEISDIHNLNINIYDLEGKLLRSSFHKKDIDTIDEKLSKEIVHALLMNPDHRLVLPRISSEGEKFSSAYSYLSGNKDQTVGIIGVPYLQDNTFQDEELREFLERLSVVYLVILVIAVVMAYFLSKYITLSLENVSKRMLQTTVERSNQKIELKEASQEIISLVDSYNSMVDRIEDSAVKLAQSERKHAWREMARQVAHEIKNPLTPMRLSVQSLDHSFDPNDPEAKEKIHEFCESMVQQIDTMSSIASAFSNFAEMPKPVKEDLNLAEEVKKALDIFQEPYIDFKAPDAPLMVRLDRIQLTRIITNLVTNSIHALKHTEEKSIEVRVREEGQRVLIEVEDNGEGISQEDAPFIFEPKFTTKSSGMGLGLPMVRNILEAYNGEISFFSREGRTVFSVSLPKD